MRFGASLVTQRLSRYIFELESGLLSQLEELLPAARPDTPTFRAEGVEVLTLEGDATARIATAARKTFRERKSRTLTSTAQKNAKAEWLSRRERPW